jgi:hypothetical protein
MSNKNLRDILSTLSDGELSSVSNSFTNLGIYKKRIIRLINKWVI